MLGAPLPPGSRAATSPSEHGREQPWLVWRWPAALRGATFALPGAVVVPFDARLGVALAVGVIPAAVLPLPPQRRDRLVIVVVGALMGISVLVGSLLATTPCLAVAGILVLAVAAAAVAIRRPRALVLLFLALPLVGVGLRLSGLATAAPLAGLFLLGAIYGYAAAIFWPSTPKPAGTDGPPPWTVVARLRPTRGFAGALCAAIGFTLHFEHVGWPTTAALLVMSPAGKTLELRALGRAVSVCAGAAATIGFLALHPSPALQPSPSRPS